MVGIALDIGRSACMREAHVNKPEGRGYSAALSNWKQRHGFADIDRAALSNLTACMRHRQEIEAWRGTLTTDEKLRLNHPSVVFAKWKRTPQCQTSSRQNPHRSENSLSKPKPK
jgi:hypothetical protein